MIAMKYGRLDVNTEEECAPEGNLPGIPIMDGGFISLTG